MPDAPFSVHRSSFDYHHTAYRAAAAKAKARSRGRCQACGRYAPLDAHHWRRPYPPAEETTADDLTGLCRPCHTMAHLHMLFEVAGGSPETLCGAWSDSMASLLLRDVDLPGSPTRVGWPVRAEGDWVACITGRCRPAVGELVGLFLRTKNQWQTVAVTDVLGGGPGCWRVRKRFLRAEIREVAA